MTAAPPDLHPGGRYTVTQAARALGVSRETVYAWTRLGRISSRKGRGEARAKYLGSHLLDLWAGRR